MLSIVTVRDKLETTGAELVKGVPEVFLVRGSEDLVTAAFAVALVRAEVATLAFEVALELSFTGADLTI
jgi:hypothetical protein